MLRLKLMTPPITWCQGSQSRKTGWGWANLAKVSAKYATTAHRLPWERGTPLGSPVEPDVNSIRAVPSAPTDARAAANLAWRAPFTGAVATEPHGIWPVSRSCAAMTGIPGLSSAAMAPVYWVPDWTKIAPGG